MKTDYDIVVIGGGPAGLAAACGAKERDPGLSVLVLERDREAGGILNQCIHNGFGLHWFKEELTGPEYAQRFVEKANAAGVEILTDTMVLSFENSKPLNNSAENTSVKGIETKSSCSEKNSAGTGGNTVYAVNSRDGLLAINAGAVVLAMGCRERTRGALAIPGDRPAGIFTAGTAQRYINMEGKMVGRRVVILGSGDIGLIMARRMTLEGAKVLACVEICPYSNGLNRNIVQCLNDYNIPLYLSHTITGIKGKHRVEKVEISRVDSSNRPIPGTEAELECDTVLLSVGLIPENELSRAAGIDLDRRTSGAVVYENRETLTPGVFACGNVLHVHDLVDFVTQESYTAGKAAAEYVLNGSGTAPDRDTVPLNEKLPEIKESSPEIKAVEVKTGFGVRYTVPQRIRAANIGSSVELYFRVTDVFRNGVITVRDGETISAQFRRSHMAPGEMEKIAILKKVLENNKSGSITVEVEVQND